MSTVLPFVAPHGAGSQVVAAGDLSLAALVIDVPDVLYDATIWRRWLFQLLVRLGVARNYRQFSRAWDAQLLDVHLGRREHAETLQSFLLSHGLTWAQVDEIEAAARIKRQQLEMDVRPLLGVTGVLGDLCQRRIPLLAWADVPQGAAWLAEQLERLLPQVTFAATLTSFELECAQPDEACYRAMLDQLSARSECVVYVGHDTEHLAGARRAGLRTVAINHEDDAEADFLLNRIEELSGVIDQVVAGERSIIPMSSAVSFKSQPDLHGEPRA